MIMRMRLDSIGKVKEFVALADRYDGAVEVSSGNDRVNGKSIMGILSLDLSNDLSVKVEEKEESRIFLQELQARVLNMEGVQG